MAGNDTAALVVALSAQLTKFEKDMKGAVDIADKRTKEIETRFAALNTTISNKFGSISASAKSNIGFLGDLLSSLGGKGTAVAVVLGAATAAVVFLASKTAEFAEKAKALKEAAETAGLTTTEFKALGSIGKTVGLDFEQTSQFFIKFLSNLEALRQGGGPLYEALLKIDVGLLRQLSTTKDSAKAIDLLVAAYSRLNDQSKKLDLAKAAGGKGGLEGVRSLDALVKVGGVGGAVAALGPFDEGQIDRAEKLQKEIDAIEKKTKNIWGGMFSDQILNAEKGMAVVMNEIAVAVERIVGAKERSLALGGSTSGLKQSDFDSRFKGDPMPLRLTVNKPASDEKTEGSPATELAILRQQIALLGDGVRQSELLRAKKLELAASPLGVKMGIENRVIEANRIAMIATALAVRERLAIATEEQIIEGRLNQLKQDAAKNGLTQNEVQRATVVIMREAKDASDALAVRRAYLPGLKQLELDAANTRKALDELAVNSLNTFADGLTDAITGTKTLSAAFKDMANSILRDLVRMSLKQALLGPLAGLIGGSAGGSFLPGASLLGGNPTGLAEGTDNWRGGPTWVGERGPEIVNLPRGAQVIPSDVARRSGGSSVNVAPVFNVDASGADSAAISRLERALARTAASIKPMALSAISEHATRAA